MSAIDWTAVSPASFETYEQSIAAGQTVAITKWRSTFTPGGISLQSASLFEGWSTLQDAETWTDVSAGVISVYSSSHQITDINQLPAWALTVPTTAVTGGTTTTTGITSQGQTSISETPTGSSPQGSIPLTASLPSNTSEPTELPEPQASGSISTGAVAGVAVGCLLGGLLIGGLIAWLLMRRRGGQQASAVYAPVQYDSPEKQPATVTTAAASSSPSGVSLDQFLLDSKPDSEIAAEARSLNLLVQQHVENNYHLQKVQQDPNALAKTLVDLEIGAEHGTDAFGPLHLANLALDPRTRHAALRHIISQAAFNASSVHHSGPVSLLPQRVGSVVRGVPPVVPHRGSAQAMETALTRWRQLSAFLLNPTRSERTPLTLSEDVSTQQAQLLTSFLNQFTGAFASSNREHAYEQENHLREVIVECAGLGYVLFSQPAEFRFNFGNTGSGPKRGKGLVTFPGLEKIRDEAGMAYQSPIAVTDPVVDR